MHHQGIITALFVLFRTALLPPTPMASSDDSIPHRVGDAMYTDHSSDGMKHADISVDVSASHSNVV
jgi:hypothetical protein